jgi:hypothetical protein
MVYMHSIEYLKQRKAGNVERNDKGYVLKDGRQFTVNDGCPTAGIHEQQPEAKPIRPYSDPAFVGGDGN